MTATDILLVTLNAKYIHAAFGLRYLYANMGDLQDRCEVLEFTIRDAPLVVAERILAKNPTIVGLGVYIWNTSQTLAVVRILKALQPDLVVVLGGPEISYEWEEQPLFALADHVITGEGEVAFPELCQTLLEGGEAAPVIAGVLPDTKTMVMPYDLYTAEDIEHRVLYVEASRGCPFKCEFCLSALDKKVRSFPLDAFLDAMASLHDRGARRFKFVDRTFNLSPKVSRAILEFFLARNPEELFLHFEMVPDRFPESLRALIQQFPPGCVQLEVGIQTMDEDVAGRIDRHQNNAKIFDNLRYLMAETGVHMHTDLIVGLPGEDLASFGRGFDALVATDVQEIQVGILKRLRGAVIDRHTDDWDMVYNPMPPYEILRNRDWSMGDLARMRRFAMYWDVIANSGRFHETLPLILGDAPFDRFMELSDHLYGVEGQSFGISFRRLLNLLLDYLTARGLDAALVASALYEDHRRVSRKSHVPERLQPWVEAAPSVPIEKISSPLPARQQRHLTRRRRPGAGSDR